VRWSIMLISVDWLPPYWCPSRRLLRSRREGRGLVTRSKIAPKTGAASPFDGSKSKAMLVRSVIPAVRLCHDATGTVRDGPGKRRHLAGDGDHDLVHVFAPCSQQAVPLTQPQLGFPRDGPHFTGAEVISTPAVSGGRGERMRRRSA